MADASNCTGRAVVTALPPAFDETTVIGIRYMKIVELNKDQLTDPDKIKPGQVLHLP